MRGGFAQTDLQGLPDEQRELAALEAIARDARQPFDLERGPLLRMRLFRLDGDRYIVSLVMHHIVSDAWSIAIFIRELATLYDALASGRSPQLPERSIQYADFAAWQRQWFQGNVLHSQLSYWQRQLANAPRGWRCRRRGMRRIHRAIAARGIQLPCLPRYATGSIAWLVPKEPPGLWFCWAALRFCCTTTANRPIFWWDRQLPTAD
jgi:hypothetical protein